MESKKIKFNGRLEWLKYETVKARCEYIDVLFEDPQNFSYAKIRSIRYRYFLDHIAFNENCKVIAVKEPEQGYNGGMYLDEPIRDNGSIFDIYGNEYKTYCQRYGYCSKNYFIIDSDEEVHRDGWWYPRIADYDDPKDFIEDINRSWE